MRRLLFWHILAIIVLVHEVSSLRVSHTIPLSTGERYSWSWIVQLVLGIIGLLYNGLALVMMLLSDRNKLPFFMFIVFINFIDLIFSVSRIIFAAVNLHYGYIYGGSARCAIESLVEITLTLWMISALVGISWVVRYDICVGKRFTDESMIAYIIVAFFYCVGISAISLFVPYGGYQVDASGTICYQTPSSYFGTNFSAFFGTLTPLIFLHYNLHVTYKIINHAQEELKVHGINELAKGQYLLMVKKLRLFLFATFLTLQPLVAMTVYEWITLQYVSPMFSIFVLIIILSLSTLINPTLFFYINYDLRVMLWSTVGRRLTQAFNILGILKCTYNSGKMSSRIVVVTSKKFTTEGESPLMSFNQRSQISTKVNSLKNKIKGFVSKSRRIGPQSPRDIESSESIDYKDINIWLTEPELLSAFQEHGRKEYAMENFLFYEDARAYYFKGLGFLARVNNVIIKYQAKRSVNSLSELESDWEDLEKIGMKLYTLYIKIPTAPLEINIPYKEKKKIESLFKLNPNNVDHTPALSRNVSAVTSSDLQIGVHTVDRVYHVFPKLVDLYNSDILEETVEKYVDIFNESIKMVQLILETDLWPRFCKTMPYHEAIAEHRNKEKKKTGMEVIPPRTIASKNNNINLS